MPGILAMPYRCFWPNAPCPPTPTFIFSLPGFVDFLNYLTIIRPRGGEAGSRPQVPFVVAPTFRWALSGQSIARLKAGATETYSNYFAAGTYTRSAVTSSAFGTSVSSLTCRNEGFLSGL